MVCLDVWTTVLEALSCWNVATNVYPCKPACRQDLYRNVLSSVNPTDGVTLTLPYMSPLEVAVELCLCYLFDQNP